MRQFTMRRSVLVLTGGPCLIHQDLIQPERQESSVIFISVWEGSQFSNIWNSWPILKIYTKNEASFSGFSPTSPAGFAFSLFELLLTFLSTFDTLRLLFGSVVGLFVRFLHAQNNIEFAYHTPPFAIL